MRSAAYVIPGYRVTFGITFFYLSLLLLIPLAAFLLYASGMGIGKFIFIASEWRRTAGSDSSSMRLASHRRSHGSASQSP